MIYSIDANSLQLQGTLTPVEIFKQISTKVSAENGLSINIDFFDLVSYDKQVQSFVTNVSDIKNITDNFYSNNGLANLNTFVNNGQLFPKNIIISYLTQFINSEEEGLSARKNQIKDQFKIALKQFLEETPDIKNQTAIGLRKIIRGS